jgi:hypothetical protein
MMVCGAGIEVLWKKLNEQELFEIYNRMRK